LVTFDTQERLRAQFIIEKAGRENSNVVETLKSHMVSNTLIEELTGEQVVLDKKAQKRDINKELSAWARQNAGIEFTTKEIQDLLKISYDATIKLVKNTDYFSKVKQGCYKILDGEAEREAAKSKRKLDN